MRRVTVHDGGRVVVIEVEGYLDAVTGHDLRNALGTVLETTTGTINLDLSRVAFADEDGIEALAWCSQVAISAGRRLMWSHSSQPLVAQLRASGIHRPLAIAKRSAAPCEPPRAGG